MNVRERLAAIKLIKKTKEYPDYLRELGVQAEMKEIRNRSEIRTASNRTSRNI